MFGKLKSAATGSSAPPPAPQVAGSNPIVQTYDIGAATASAGPELVWRIYDAVRKSDGKVS